MTSDDTHDRRPGLAVVAPTQEWYRHALHRRFVAEIPELRLHSIYTRTQGLARREPRDESDVNAVFFDHGSASGERNRLGNQRPNLERGTRIFRYFRENNVQAALILGYNDIGLVRLFSQCKREGIRTFLWSDSNAAGDRATGLKRLVKGAVIRRVARLADSVLVCGSLGRAFYTSYGVPESRIIYSPYEPDYAQIRSLPEETIRDIRERFDLDPARKRFVFCGRLVRIKRPDLALRVFVNIAGQRPGWDLVIVGDGEMRQELEQSIPGELRRRVRFTGFLGDQSHVSAIYRVCDVLVHPSEIEPWGLIINEAVAAGLAIVSTTSCGAAVELVDNGKNGFLVPPAEIEPLERAMLTLSDPIATQRFKDHSSVALDRWRQTADPVAGLRTALARAGLIAEHRDPGPCP